jgi:hypothetical protein
MKERSACTQIDTTLITSFNVSVTKIIQSAVPRSEGHVSHLPHSASTYRPQDNKVSPSRYVALNTITQTWPTIRRTHELLGSSRILSRNPNMALLHRACKVVNSLILTEFSRMLISPVI